MESFAGSLYHVETSLLMLCKSMDWFLYSRDLRHERVKFMLLGKVSAGFFSNVFWGYKEIIGLE